MYKDNTEEHILRNLEDAGCDENEIRAIMRALENGERKRALAMLAKHRQALLDSFHKSKYCIDCLDYLVNGMEKGSESRNGNNRKQNL